VKDVLAYLRVLANPKDDASTLRVLQTPPRGLGKSSLAKLKAFASAQGKPLSEAIAFAEAIDDLPKRARAGLRAVEETFERLRARLTDTAENLVRAVIEETHYLTYLEQEYPEEDERQANVEALVAGAREFDRRSVQEVAKRQIAPPALTVKKSVRDKVKGPQGTLFAEPVREELTMISQPSDDVMALEPGLQGFLEQIALLAEEDAAKAEDTREKVQLMTVHTAKGLEFEHVFLIGLEDGCFPNARALEEPDGLEEERRLAYVALTRARKQLYLVYAGERARFGRTSTSPPSGFLFELPDSVWKAGESPRSKQPHGMKASEQVWDEDELVDEGAAEVDGEERLWQRPLGGAKKEKKPNEARELFQQLGERVRAAAASGPSPEELAVGDRVRHEHFGLGKIVEVSGQGMSRRVKVAFLEFGEKNLVLQYARLSKVTS